MQKNQPDNQNIIIDRNNLSALPEDCSIHYSLLTRNTLPEVETLVAERNLSTQRNLQTFDDSESLPDTISVVPNLHLAETKLSQLQQYLKGQCIESFLSSNENEPIFE